MSLAMWPPSFANPPLWARDTSIWYRSFTNATFCDVTLRGAPPCSNAVEASAELLAVHSPPPEACTADREKLGSCGRSVRAGRHSPNVTRRRATPTVHHHKSTAGPNGSAERLECTVPFNYGWAWPTRALSFAQVAHGTMLSSRLECRGCVNCTQP